MTGRLFRWFRGYIHIGLKGSQISRFLNLCSGNGIHLWNITHNIESYIRVHVHLRDFYALKPYLRKTKTRMHIIGKHGFPFWCYRHPHLKWFPVLLLILLCAYLYSTTFIWGIHIQGNEQISENEILTFLAEHEIEVGRKKTLVNCSEIEYDIRQAFQNLGWVSVSLHGTQLHVSMKESLYDEHTRPVKDENRYDLIANKDAYIYSMITRAGTAIIKEDCHVKKGDVLVMGICRIYNDAGEIDRILKLKAEAYILGDVTYEFMHPVTEIEIVAHKIAGIYSDKSLMHSAQRKLNHFAQNLEKKRVIILDKNVMIKKEEKHICFFGQLIGREEIGINIQVEDEQQE